MPTFSSASSNWLIFRTIGGVDEQNIFVKSRSCETIIVIIVIVRHSLLQRFLVDTRTSFRNCLEVHSDAIKQYLTNVLCLNTSSIQTKKDEARSSIKVVIE